MKITNTSKANQGVYTTDGLKFIEPGQTRDLDVASDYVERVQALPFLTVGCVDEVKTAPALADLSAADLRKVAADEGADVAGLRSKTDMIEAIIANRNAVETVQVEAAHEDPRTDDELRAAVVDQLGEEGAAELDRTAMLALLAPNPGE